MKVTIFNFISVLLLGLIIGPNAQANSFSDIMLILADSRICDAVGTEEIDKIENLGSRSYEVTFGKCSLVASVVSLCAPMPNSPCLDEVKYYNEVNCSE